MAIEASIRVQALARLVVSSAVRGGKNNSRVVLALVAALLIVLIFLFTKGGPERQDADETEGTWQIAVEKFSFPEDQTLGKTATMELTVVNEETTTMPSVVVSLDGLNIEVDRPTLADPNRPIWIVDESPIGGTTASVHTWQSGPLPAGEARTLRWKMTPVRAGTFPVTYKVAAGLHGKAKAVVEGEGAREVTVEKSPTEPKIP